MRDYETALNSIEVQEFIEKNIIRRKKLLLKWKWFGVFMLLFGTVFLFIEMNQMSLPELSFFLLVDMTGIFLIFFFLFGYPMTFLFFCIFASPDYIKLSEKLINRFFLVQNNSVRYSKSDKYFIRNLEEKIFTEKEFLAGFLSYTLEHSIEFRYKNVYVSGAKFVSKKLGRNDSVITTNDCYLLRIPININDLGLNKKVVIDYSNKELKNTLFVNIFNKKIKENPLLSKWKYLLLNDGIYVSMKLPNNFNVMPASSIEQYRENFQKLFIDIDTIFYIIRNLLGEED